MMSANKQLNSTREGLAHMRDRLYLAFYINLILSVLQNSGLRGWSCSRIPMEAAVQPNILGDHNHINNPVVHIAPAMSWFSLINQCGHRHTLIQISQRANNLHHFTLHTHTAAAVAHQSRELPQYRPDRLQWHRLHWHIKKPIARSDTFPNSQ